MEVVIEILTQNVAHQIFRLYNLYSKKVLYQSTPDNVYANTNISVGQW